MYACWEGKSFLLTIEDFTSYAYKEAAEALLTKQAAEGYPPGLFLQHIELELSKIRVEATPQAVAAANALILKKVEGAAIKLQGCFTGKALDTITTLGTSKFHEWKMKLLTDSAGQDPKLVYKLTQMIQHGLVVEDNSSNNALNYREMTSKDDIGAVYREHMPRMYNLVLAVIRAHNAKEKMRKIEREGGMELEEATPSFDQDGELLPPKTPAMAKMLRTHTSAMQSLPPLRTKTPKARKHLRLGEEKQEEEVQIDNLFNPLIPEEAESSDESSDDEKTYEAGRQLAHQQLLAQHAQELQVPGAPTSDRQD